MTPRHLGVCFPLGSWILWLNAEPFRGVSGSEFRLCPVRTEHSGSSPGVRGVRFCVDVPEKLSGRECLFSLVMPIIVTQPPPLSGRSSLCTARKRRHSIWGTNVSAGATVHGSE